MLKFDTLISQGMDIEFLDNHTAMSMMSNSPRNRSHGFSRDESPDSPFHSEKNSIRIVTPFNEDTSNIALSKSMLPNIDEDSETETTTPQSELRNYIENVLSPINVGPSPTGGLDRINLSPGSGMGMLVNQIPVR